MSGHSHWATIKHKKGAIDAKRGKLFSKLSRAIIIAARHGGGDPETNLKLRYAIDKAREVSMPKENIERAVKRGTGETEGITFEEITYEGYGPGGVAFLVDVLTDNRNRTNSEIRKIFERSGGKMGSAGNVGFLFERKGVFSIDATATDEDTLMSIALDAGADDLKRVGSSFEVTCDPAAFNQVKEALQKNNLTPTFAEISQVPKAPREVDTDMGKKVMRLMEALDDHDDVQNVYSDANITEAMVAEAG
ncbi:MAG TPA: YebC/PmpR family DNA-binding transcriptional regulator [Gemmataceae bacterium]|jgi:YebC/PmpR family DNA-binding regulatory protein|nr:YebC/PmpR family DNA-binding transcriptional regulator [Gemmataceae bacterium]HEV3445366.1 YebC/PmpR family DNA-binding transcriptional regulator [Gemmataceae bacterium]